MLEGAAPEIAELAPGVIWELPHLLMMRCTIAVLRGREGAHRIAARKSRQSRNSDACILNWDDLVQRALGNQHVPNVPGSAVVQQHQRLQDIHAVARKDFGPEKDNSCEKVAKSPAQCLRKNRLNQPKP